MKLKTKETTLCGLFIALIAIGAFLKITIPLPIYDMSFTLQWLFVICASLLLGAKLGTASVGIYLLMGLVGIPIFAHGGGISYVLRPGFGFLLGFFAAAFVMGLMVDKGKSKKWWWYLASSSVGLVIYYTIGAIYFYLMTNLYIGTQVDIKTVVVDYCLITVAPDFLLCVFASIICYKLKPRLNKITKN